MEPSRGTKRRGLTRTTIVARALEVGAAEGLEAVSLRRLASDLGVTPMALYRHVTDKQDLLNAMAEAVMEGFELKAGFRPSMSWTERLRRALTNFKEQMDARPLALPLSIAYTGENPVAFWRMVEDLLSILLEAGFPRREAIVLIRMISNLVTGYLLLFRQDEAARQKPPGPHELDLLRRRMELNLLSLPRDEFVNIVDSGRDLAEIWLSNPDRWWRNTVDLIVFGLAAMLERRGRQARTATGASVPRPGASRIAAKASRSTR
jgi:AcrR family transcriptional regulator